MVSSSFDIENVFNIMKKDPIPYITNTHSIQNLFIIQNRPPLVKELHYMCMKTHYKEKNSLFYKSLLYLDIIMHEAVMAPNVALNYSLLCLNALSLGIKFTKNQINIPRISQLQHLNRKCNAYTLDDCLENETLCVKLMNFRLVYSSCYDYLEMFLIEKDALFEKAKDLLDRISSQRCFIQKHPYHIACIIVSYCLEFFNIRDLQLQRRFISDKNNQSYQKFINIIINTPNYNGNDCTRSTSSSFSTSTFESQQGNQRNSIIEKYTKIRQASKNIEMLRTSELKLLVDFSQANKQDDNNNNNMIRVNTIQGKKDLNQVKDQSRRSCINVFSSTSGNISNKNSNSNITPIHNNNNYNSNSNINPQYSNSSSKLTNYHSVFNTNSHPQKKIFNCLSDTKVNHIINIDLKTVAKLNIRHVATFNMRKNKEIK